MTDDCKAILKGNKFNKADAYNVKEEVTQKKWQKEVPTLCKYNQLNAKICIGRLGGKSNEQKVYEYFHNDGAI